MPPEGQCLTALVTQASRMMFGSQLCTFVLILSVAILITVKATILQGVILLVLILNCALCAFSILLCRRPPPTALY